jgi:hypothetical protein
LFKFSHFFVIQGFVIGGKNISKLLLCLHVSVVQASADASARQQRCWHQTLTLTNIYKDYKKCWTFAKTCLYLGRKFSKD